ncbi:MAG TPA: hypothetical protein PKE04_23135 [Clostridia bacterium]|nr:hypothetical protein [Clostridia bacterium]
MRRLKKILGILCALFLVPVVPASLAGIAPMGAIWLNRDTQPAMDLDADGLYDAVEYITTTNQCILRFRFGNGLVIGYLLGNSAQMELVKIDAADLTSNGNREIVMMAYDPGSQQYSFHVLRIRNGELQNLPVPSNALDDAYRFKVTLVRGYALEIRNADDSFLLLQELDPTEYAPLFREDGSVPKQDVRIAPFQNFSIIPYAAGYAMELKQAVSYGSDNILFGYVVSTLVWRSGEAILVGQRFDAF